MIKDGIGLTHLIASIFALLSGSIVLFLNKGTLLHKKVGYFYCMSMMITLLSSFMIYRFYRGWGLFHYMAVVSTLTLLLGMLPFIVKKEGVNPIKQHFRFMYWSVAGLYCAFAAELFVRVPGLSTFSANLLPKSIFHLTVLLATLLVLVVSIICFRIKKPLWSYLANKYRLPKQR